MKKIQNILQLLIVVGIIFAANVIFNYFYTEIDLTEEKRYTINDSTKKVVKSLDDVMYIRVLLEGDFPPGFTRLRNATKELLDEFKDLNPDIEYVFEDPLEGSGKARAERAEQLSKDGIIPMALSYYNGKELVKKGVYPYAIISYKGRSSKVSLVKEQTAGEDQEITLNKSVERLEYNFANLFQKLTLKRRQNIAFTSEHGELTFDQTYRLTLELREKYNVGTLNLDSLITIDQAVDLLVVAGPTKPYSEQEKFKIDQYIMNGGNVIWMIDKLDAHLDSIQKYKFYIPNETDTNLDDMLFKYGVRINPNLVLDKDNTPIGQRIGQQGSAPQLELFPWFYHPLAMPNGNHPIGRNIDRVNLFFPSSIETLKTKTGIQMTPLLTSTPNSRYQLNPVRLTFEILKLPVVDAEFNKGKQTLGVLMEGEFESAYKNRVSESFQAGLDQLNITFKEKSTPTKQMVFTDSDFIKNLLNLQDNSTLPIGYNKWNKRVYEGNKDFILNAIEYMLDENGVLDSRSKQVQLRMLDPVKTSKEKTKWQLINIIAPLIFLGIFGFLFNYMRKRKYTKTN